MRTSPPSHRQTFATYLAPTQFSLPERQPLELEILNHHHTTSAVGLIPNPILTFRPSKMSHHTEPGPVLSSAEKHYLTTCSHATILLPTPGLPEGSSHSTLQYALSSPAPRVFCRVESLTRKKLKYYAPLSPNLQDYQGRVIVPIQLYGKGGKDEWPYDDNLRDGRPFTKILDWVNLAWACNGTYLREVKVQVPMNIPELLAYLAACNAMGMDDPAVQIEKHILGMLMCMPLQLRDIRALWSYVISGPLVLPLPRGQKELIVEVTRTFFTAGILHHFAHNLRTITPDSWSSSPSTTGPEKFEQHSDYEIYLMKNAKLHSLVFKPDLKLYIEMIEPKPDKEWRKVWFRNWVVENWKTFGEGIRAPREIPGIESSKDEAGMD